MTGFFANSAFLGLAVLAFFIGRENFLVGVEISCAAIVLVLLHKIEGHLYNQTALMVQDSEEDDSYTQHSDIPLDIE